jgi:murein DD-endopeptidase MepM/ murein hydrolase activator NlpD
VIEKKPIRKDRVALVAVFLLAVILVPILLRSGGPSPPATPTQPVVTDTAPIVAPPVDVTMLPGSITEGPPLEDGFAGEGPVILEHTVEAGETLGKIASLLGVSVDQIVTSNRIRSPESLAAGQTIRVPQKGILHVIKKGQTLTDISLTYAVSVEEIIAANGITNPEMIYAGEEILIPRDASLPWRTVVALSKGRETRFIWPLVGEVVSTFGWRVHPVLQFRHHHNGIDIDVPEGTTVVAAAAGLVSFVGEEEGYGTMLVLSHADDYITAYGHLSRVFVYSGQFVEAGQPIAESGNTGISSGPHLHFEVRNREFPIDPMRYLP